MKKILAILAGLSVAVSVYAIQGTYVQVTCNIVTTGQNLVSDGSGNPPVSYSTCGEALAQAAVYPYYLKSTAATSNYVTYLFSNS